MNYLIDNPKITVLMSFYNNERFTISAINSILEQTFEDFEFLIINDCSKDKSAEKVKNLSDKRIILINNKENIGLTKSLNIGLGLAKGKYIARMDADDIAYPERLETQFKFFENNKDYGLVSSWAEVINEKGNIINKLIIDHSPEEIFYRLHFCNCIVHSSAMFPKELVLKVGGYNNNFYYSQDYELWSKLFKFKKFFIIPKFLIQWRKILEGISEKNYNNQYSSSFIIANSNLEINKDLFEYFWNQYSQISIRLRLKLIKDLILYNKNIYKNYKNTCLVFNEFLLKKIFIKEIYKILKYRPNKKR